MLVSWVLSWPQHVPQSEPLVPCSHNALLRLSVQSAPLKLRKAQSRKLCATSHPHYNANCSRSRLWIEIKTAEITVVLISILFWVEPESIRQGNSPKPGQDAPAFPTRGGTALPYLVDWVGWAAWSAPCL